MGNLMTRDAIRRLDCLKPDRALIEYFAGLFVKYGRVYIRPRLRGKQVGS